LRALTQIEPATLAPNEKQVSRAAPFERDVDRGFDAFKATYPANGLVAGYSPVNVPFSVMSRSCYRRGAVLRRNGRSGQGCDAGALIWPGVRIPINSPGYSDPISPRIPM
jgi:hypothetical protein